MGIWEGFTHEIVTDNYWTPERPDAKFPRALKRDLRNIDMADRDLINGAYLRLKTATLSYNLPSSVLQLAQNAGIQSVSIYVSGTNLITFSELNDFDLDPESIPGNRTHYYPQTSLKTIGLNIIF